MALGVLAEREAVQLVAALLDGGARFPFNSAGEFIPWARDVELLDREDAQR